MNLLKIELQINLMEANQVSSFKHLIDTIAGNPTTEQPAPVEKIIPGKVEPVKTEAKKQETKKVEPKKQETKKVEPKAEEPAKVEPKAKEKKSDGTPEDITIDQVRELLATKVAGFRTEIKTKLTDLGAPNVTSLDETKYAEFHDFLEGLK